MLSSLALDAYAVKLGALLFFVALWIAILARVVLARRGKYDSDAQMPLDDERPVEPRTPGS